MRSAVGSSTIGGPTRATARCSSNHRTCRRSAHTITTARSKAPRVGAVRSPSAPTGGHWRKIHGILRLVSEAIERFCEHCGRRFLVRRKSLSGPQLRGEKPFGRYCSRACTARAAGDERALQALLTMNLSSSHIVRESPAAIAQLKRKPRPRLSDRLGYGTCGYCSRPFPRTRASRRYCSDRCQRVDAGTTARRRARRFGVPYEPIKPTDVFERDGWRCQVCGRRTPKRWRGTMPAQRSGGGPSDPDGARRRTHPRQRPVCLPLV